MNTIKLLNGIRTQGYKILLLCSIISISCEDSLRSPLFYQIVIQNNYFEKIKNVTLENQKISNINTKEHSKTLFLRKGIYNFSFSTESNLTFRSSIEIKGYKKSLHLIIEEKGSLIIK